MDYFIVLSIIGFTAGETAGRALVGLGFNTAMFTDLNSLFIYVFILISWMRS